MARSEQFEKDWAKLEQEIIYVKRALNSGIFSGGYFYDFYQEKEAVAAEKFVNESEFKDCISTTTIIKVSNSFADLYRLNIVLNTDMVGDNYKKK